MNNEQLTDKQLAEAIRAADPARGQEIGAEDSERMLGELMILAAEQDATNTDPCES